MSTRFKSVAEAAAHLAGDDPEVGKRVKNAIQRNELVSVLLQMRIEKGLTQEEIADRMKCGPSTVSRIESGNDRQLKWSDIIGYVSALKIKMGILFDDETLPASTKIKQCVFKIDEQLKALTELAKSTDDPSIAQGIDRFYKDVLFNFAKRFGENRAEFESVLKVIKFPATPKPPEGTQPPTEASCGSVSEAATA